MLKYLKRKTLSMANNSVLQKWKTVGKSEFFVGANSLYTCYNFFAIILLCKLVLAECYNMYNSYEQL